MAAEVIESESEAENPIGNPGPTITHVDFMMENRRGFQLFCQEWHNEDVPRNLVVFVQHGYADHSSRTISILCEYIVRELGGHVFAMDLQGHGQSAGDRVHIELWAHVIEDFCQFVDHVSAQYPKERYTTFLVGESMGGAVVIDAARARPEIARGLVLLAPMVKIAAEMKPPAWQIPLFKGLAKIAPKWQALPENGDICSKAYRDPEQQELARADPLRYSGKTRLGTAFQLLTASNDIEAHLEEVRTPFLVLHGTADQLTSYENSVELVQRASTEDKTMKSYEGAFHSLVVEPDGVGETVMADIVRWIRDRFAPETASVSAAPESGSA